MRLCTQFKRGRQSCTEMASLGLVVLSSLLWLPTAVADKTAADYFVHSLPGQPDGPLLKMHAGHITVNEEHHGNLFFWFFQNRHIANKQRTVIWLNGGPGCSSLDGALMEIGPYRVGKGGKLHYNDGSWDEFANVLFVDNPVGTGFSYVDTNSYLHELQEMADQFLIFMEKWYALFPDYLHDDIYIAGESYAGQHIPYIGRAILDANQKKKPEERMNLKGLIIGNGWIDPPNQYLSYLPYAYQEGLVQGGTDIAKQIEAQQTLCTQALSSEGAHRVDTNACERVMTSILDLTKKKGGDPMQKCVNMYDIRLRDDDSCGMNWPPDLADVTPYLRRNDVTAALHVDPDKRTGWTECNGAVSANFRAQNSKPSIELLPGLLKEVPILLFSGDRDLICNHLGTESLISNLEFNGGKGFELSPGVTAPRRDWAFENEPAGFWQEARNLTYVVFYNSSHMVPFDYPRRTRDMLDRYMGVDIASVGGKPVDSKIDGEKGPVTSVGGHPNSTAAEEEQKEKLKEAEWRAYQKSGEVVLVLVIVAVSAWAFFIWRSRRNRAEYKGLGLFGAGGSREALSGAMGMENFRDRRSNRDLEAADFDEHELEDSPGTSHAKKERYDDDEDENKKLFDQGDQDMERDRYSIGGSSDDDDFGDDRRPAKGAH